MPKCPRDTLVLVPNCPDTLAPVWWCPNVFGSEVSWYHICRTCSRPTMYQYHYQYFIWDSKGHLYLHFWTDPLLKGNAILCFTDTTGNLQSLTPGLHFTVCHVSSMSHVTEYLNILFISHANWKMLTMLKKRNKQHVFLLCSVHYRLWQSRNKTGYDWARVWWNHEVISLKKTWQQHLVLGGSWAARGR